ncbi:pheromone-processing carboxypeptidase KEX1-like [Capsicum galapagoense]
MYPTVKETVSEWLAVCPIKARSVVDVPKKVEQPHTLNDQAFQEDDSQLHEIYIDENEILNTLNDPDGMLTDMGEGEEKEGDGREEDENDENDEDEDEDVEDEDEDEDEDGDGDGDGDGDEDEVEDDDEDEDKDDEAECELHKKKRRRI